MEVPSGKQKEKGQKTKRQKAEDDWNKLEFTFDGDNLDTNVNDEKKT